MIAVIETERLRLVPPDNRCIDSYLQFYTDEQASREYGGPLTEEQVFARLKADLGCWHLLGFGVWAIERKADNRIIGTCGFWQGRAWPRELTWWLLPEARRQGIAFEASRAAIDHAYRHWQWPVVETYMNDDNHPARALVEKLGGIKARREAFTDGLSRDIYRLPPC